MKLIEFTYTKDTGEQSQRAVIELVVPSKFIEGWDGSQLDPVDFVKFTETMNEIKRRHHEEVLNILQEYDLTHNYLRFKPENMSDIQVEYV